MKKFEQLGRSLSKLEQKKIVGGIEDEDFGPFCGGECHGTVGSWYYPGGGVGRGVCLDDIRTYCSSGSGRCIHC